MCLGSSFYMFACLRVRIGRRHFAFDLTKYSNTVYIAQVLGAQLKQRATVYIAAATASAIDTGITACWCLRLLDRRSSSPVQNARVQSHDRRRRPVVQTLVVASQEPPWEPEEPEEPQEQPWEAEEASEHDSSEEHGR